jgi:uncharacterized membrane protein
MPQYFSDKERGAKPRVEQEVTAAAWGGIVFSILFAVGAAVLALIGCFLWFGRRSTRS